MSLKLHFFYFSLCFLLITRVSFAQDFIGNIIALSATAPKKIVFVDKSKKVLYLINQDEKNQETLMKFNILLGENEGDKLVEGDLKTPEGIYYITTYLSPDYMRKSFGKGIALRYGDGAYPISYPNVLDKKEKKTGHGIWIHGLNPERTRIATDGCVGLENDFLNQIQPHLEIGTPVVVSPCAMYLDKAEYEKLKDHHKKYLNSFINVWLNGSNKELENFISSDYTGYYARNKKEYLEKKANLRSKKDKKYLQISSSYALIENTDEVVYDFNQFYCADNLVAYGNKKLYTKLGLVITEEYFSLPFTEPMREAIYNFVRLWISDWESKNIDNFSKHYSFDFKKYKEFMENKKNIFISDDEIKIVPTDISWKHTGGNNFSVTFTQLYKTDKYSDKGIKEISIKGCPGDFKIVSESWKSLAK